MTIPGLTTMPEVARRQEELASELKNNVMNAKRDAERLQDIRKRLDAAATTVQDTSQLECDIEALIDKGLIPKSYVRWVRLAYKSAQNEATTRHYHLFLAERDLLKHVPPAQEE